jgi:hypothetical protein
MYGTIATAKRPFDFIASAFQPDKIGTSPTGKDFRERHADSSGISPALPVSNHPSGSDLAAEGKVQKHTNRHKERCDS